MLVQLRRVVYLLVLLQCYVSVTHISAASGDRSRDALVKEMNGLANEMHSLSNEIEEHRRNLSSEISLCERNKVHTKTLAAGISKLAGEIGDWLTAWRAKGGTEEMFRKQVGLEIERTNMAVRETKEVAARIRSTVKDTTDVVNKLKTVYKKFLSDQDEYMTWYYIMGIGGFDARKYEVATRSKKHLEKALGVIKSANEYSKSVWQCAAEAEEAADIAGNATTLLNERVKKILPPSGEPPAHGRQEATTGQPSGELSDASPTVALEDPSHREETNVGVAVPTKHEEQTSLDHSEDMKDATMRRDQETEVPQSQESQQETVEQRHVDARNNGGLAEGNKRQEDNEVIKPAADGAAKQGNVNVLQNKDEQMAEKPNAEMSSRKLKETMNTSSATTNFQPHQLPSGSLSSGSLHSVITRLSDSSNSPALLHGPLLLLALLCVLGCTGVF